MDVNIIVRCKACEAGKHEHCPEIVYLGPSWDGVCVCRHPVHKKRISALVETAFRSSEAA